MYFQIANSMSSTGRSLDISFDFASLFSYVQDMFKILTSMLFTYTNNKTLAFLIFISLVIYIGYLIFKKEFKYIFILLCGIGFQLVFSRFVYNIGAHMIGITFGIILFSLYLGIDKKYTKYLLLIIFASTLYRSFDIYTLDYKYLYTDSQNVANYIENNILEGSNIYTVELCYTSSIIANLPKDKYNFINISNKEKFTYADWSFYKHDEALMEFINNGQIDDDVKYFIGLKIYIDYFKKKLSQKEYKIKYLTDNTLLSDESYVLFEIIE